jgi:hypothetical protein
MHNLISSFQAATKRCLFLARSRDSLANADVIIISTVILGIWLTGVIFTATTHEFWRDEVRALSLARAAISPIDLYRLLQNEGHPILWYLLLYIGKSIINTPLILPVTSIIIAFAAVLVFMFFSPFPLWLKTLFIFSVLPFYEYAVMARNYGISMLFFFVFAALYPKRYKYPLLLALVLFFLANTNAHSAILACLVAFVWFWDVAAEKNTISVKRPWMSIYAALVIVFLGFMLCLFTTWPSDKTIVTHFHSLGLTDVAKSFIKAMVFPAQKFQSIIPNIPDPADQVLLYIAIFGLIPRINLFLAALSGQVALGMFFDLIYRGDLRHQGLFLVFLIFLYWIAMETPHLGVTNRIKNMLFKAGLYVSLLIMIFFGFYKAKGYVIHDIRWELSSSKALGAFINGSGIYRDAIIVPEPDYLVESLPYYANNEIYLPREQRFGKTVSFTTDANDHISLSDLLATAYKIKKKYDRPVLIVFGHWNLDKRKVNKKRFSFNSIFSWNAKDLSELSRTTKLVGKFKSARSDENYMVYAID